MVAIGFDARVVGDLGAIVRAEVKGNQKGAADVVKETTNKIKKIARRIVKTNERQDVWWGQYSRWREVGRVTEFIISHKVNNRERYVALQSASAQILEAGSISPHTILMPWGQIIHHPGTTEFKTRHFLTRATDIVVSQHLDNFIRKHITGGTR